MAGPAVMKSTAPGRQPLFDPGVARNVACVLLGAAALASKARYSGPHTALVHSYGGNVAASFAVYFILATPLSRLNFGRALRAILGLAVVDIFEATDGFQVMANTYDPVDYLANGVGIVLALVVDAVAARVAGRSQSGKL